MKVAVLVCDKVFDSGLASILDVFETANAMAVWLAESPRWNVTTIGFESQIRTSAGHLVDCEPVSEAELAELLVVPAVNERQPDDLIDFVSGARSRPARRLIAESHRRGLEIASACTGTFLLAESGILNELKATTAWWLMPAFRTRYRKVWLDEGSMVVHDEDITTAGAAFAHVDLALALVRSTSPAIADLVAHYLVIDERPSQAPYVIPSLLAQHDPTLAAFERWAHDRLATPISIPAAADYLGITERTLRRTIHRALGITPLRYIHNLRLERAIHLLRTTNLTLDTIAHQVGYPHATTLHSALRRHTRKPISKLRTGPLY